MIKELTLNEFKKLTIKGDYFTNELIPYPHIAGGKKPVRMELTINDEYFAIDLSNLENDTYIDVPKGVKYLPSLHLYADGSNESGEGYNKYDIKLEGAMEEGINSLELLMWWEDNNSKFWDKYILV